jgi:hypothetical protein
LRNLKNCQSSPLPPNLRKETCSSFASYDHIQTPRPQFLCTELNFENWSNICKTTLQLCLHDRMSLNCSFLRDL